MSGMFAMCKVLVFVEQFPMRLMCL